MVANEKKYIVAIFLIVQRHILQKPTEKSKNSRKIFETNDNAEKYKEQKSLQDFVDFIKIEFYRIYD